MKIKIQGSPNQNIELSDTIFNTPKNPKLLAQVVKKILANRRRPIAHTKIRSEVRGGGRKPFRQKGTGRARAGSIRSPLWIGGGTVFGPRKSRNFSQKTPKKVQKKVLTMAMTEKAKNGRLVVVKEFNFKKISTAQIQDFLEKLPIEEGKILIVLAKTNANLELSAANLPYLKVCQVSGLNLLDLLKSDYIITDKVGIIEIQKYFKG